MYSLFSSCSKYVYAITNRGKAYIFETQTGKMVSYMKIIEKKMDLLSKEDDSVEFDADGVLGCCDG